MWADLPMNVVRKDHARMACAHSKVTKILIKSAWIWQPTSIPPDPFVNRKGNFSITLEDSHADNQSHIGFRVWVNSYSMASRQAQGNSVQRRELSPGVTLRWEVNSSANWKVRGASQADVDIRLQVNFPSFCSLAKFESNFWGDCPL